MKLIEEFFAPYPLLHGFAKSWVEDVNHSNPYFSPLYYIICRNIGARHILEIGCERGYSSYMLAMAAKENEGMYYCIEKSSAWADELKKNLVEHNFPHVLIWADSKDIKEFVWSDKLDFVLLDGEHSVEAIQMEFAMIYPKLSGGSYVALHDSEACSSEGFVALLQDPQYNFEYINFTGNYGLTLFRKREHNWEELMQQRILSDGSQVPKVGWMNEGVAPEPGEVVLLSSSIPGLEAEIFGVDQSIEPPIPKAAIVVSEVGESQTKLETIPVVGIEKAEELEPPASLREYLSKWDKTVIVGDGDMQIEDIQIEDIQIGAAPREPIRQLDDSQIEPRILPEPQSKRGGEKIVVVDTMVTDFSERRVAEYLQAGGRYLIRFGHGLGDTIMFMPIYHKLCRLYPECQIDLYVESGQEEIWESVPDKDAPGYDVVFSLDFPMAEGTDITKPAKCCIAEIGIDPITDVAALPQELSPIVTIHFHGTALPGSVGCPEEVAKQIWQEVIDSGRVPMECHYEHLFHNKVNEKFSFVDNNVRGCDANLHSLIGLIQHSGAFIGVASGPFVVALSVMPKRTLYLEKHHEVKCYTEKSIATVDVLDYRSGSVSQWLESIA